MNFVAEHMLGEINHWPPLVGHTIELFRDGTRVRIAEVEDATADSSVMWLRFDGIHGRQLITRGDGYDVRVID
ncbi:hypothetical protein [Arthrobacter sp. NPDC058127]|uniref:hypothetical protein n=1 Tax=Arthrobacter sp. NPDC058127 TaxID=3346351 RepID=UPI0036EB2E79